MHPHIPSSRLRTPLTRRLTFVAALTLAGNASAEIESELDALVISALRTTPTDASRTTSAVTVLDPADLIARGVLDLRDALNEAPGVIATSTAGQTGAVGSVFIRGTTTAYSQLVVDGIRLSDSTAPLGNFLSAAGLDDLGRIEVLRGPQAAIYGGEALGGVIWLETARGEGDPATRLRLEGGSFDSFDGHLSQSGQSGRLSWFVGGGYDATRNDGVDQDFDQGRGALRLEWAQSDSLTLGMTFRTVSSSFEYDNFGPNTDHIDTSLATVYADARLAPGWTTRLTAGHHRENYDNDSGFGNYSTDLDRTVVFNQHILEISPRHQLMAGAFFEHVDFQNAIGSDVGQNLYGAHLGWQWTPVESLVADAVVRWEDYAGYEDETTWRLGASWQALETTRFRSGVGRAFRTPGFLDLYGTNFGAGNPLLSPESAIGWDLGIEQNLGANHRASVTWFENSIRDRIRSFPTPPVNLAGDTPTRGLETALDGSWCDRVWNYRLAWTWLTESLQDQPENALSASLDWRPTDKLLFGVGGSYLDKRSWGGDPLDAYLLVRIYGSYRVNDALTLHARVENLSDTDYQLSRFPFSPRIDGPGLGFFAGITTRF